MLPAVLVEAGMTAVCSSSAVYGQGALHVGVAAAECAAVGNPVGCDGWCTGVGSLCHAYMQSAKG